MAQLIFPIPADELIVGVRVNHPGTILAAIQAAGRPAPASVPTTGLLDTGSNVTAVSPVILRGLAIPLAGVSRTRGVGGSVSVDLYSVSLSILDPTRPQDPWFVQPNLLVMEMPAGLPLDVLIGMDVLLGCRLLIDGPARQFTIDF